MEQLPIPKESSDVALKKLDTLTERQAEVLKFIMDFVEFNQSPPTRQQIADYFGFQSVNSSEDHLKALAKKGVIILGNGHARSIKVTVARRVSLRF